MTDTDIDAIIVTEKPTTLCVFARQVPTTGFSSDIWPGPGRVYFFAVLYPSKTLLCWFKGEWRTSKQTEYIEE